MRRFKTKIAIVGAALASCALAAPADQAAAKLFGKQMEMPSGFEANQGQAPTGVDFVSHGIRHNLYLTHSGARLDVGSYQQFQTVNLDFIKPASPRAKGIEPLPGKTGYLIGSDRSKWIQNITNYTRVRYEQVWQGMDVVYYGHQNRLEYDVVVAPGADPAQAAIAFRGAKALRINAEGDLVIVTSAGEITQKKPAAYQMTGHGRREVAARYLVNGNQIRFGLGDYDRSRELVIDPLLLYSFPRINNAYNSGNGVAVDASGNAYFVGTTLPLNTNPNTKTDYTAVWIASTDIAGNARYNFIVGATDGNSTGTAIAADSAGYVYLTGSVTEPAGSQGFPLAGAYQPTSGGNSDAYLLKLIYANSSASAAYGTYIGGAGNDAGNAITLDGSGYTYVAGSTTSSNFPNGATTLSTAGSSDAFVTKINAGLSGANSFVYSYLAGGSGADSAQGVAVQGGNLYLAGSTASGNFQPLSTNGYDVGKSSASNDGFLLKTSATAPSTPSYFTFLQFGPFSALAVDAAGNAYLTGQTTGLLPTNALNQGPQLGGGAGHAFIVRFNTTAASLASYVYLSYLAGGLSDAGTGIAVDASGNAVVVGNTTSTNFPIAGTPFSSTLSGSSDGFISKVNTNAASTASLVFSSYFGGTGADTINAVALTPYYNPVITGQTSSPNLPVPAGQAFDGGTDTRAFASKILFEAAPFGSLDIPATGSTNLVGAVNFGGWALSSIGISTVAIWRNPLPGEATAANGYVFVANTALVPGARPDVAASYPGYPENNYGWGLQVLTNELPGTGGLALGNGTYTFHAIATDNDGLAGEIGHTTVSASNSSSALPFGTIDTPAQGAVVSGTAYVNFGWVVTPLPNTIPKDGSTILVYIDNVAVGHPVYNNYRSDIATLFPGLNNSGNPANQAAGGAVGFYVINTTTLSNGLHTISWTVTDNAGHARALEAAISSYKTS